MEYDVKKFHKNTSSTMVKEIQPHSPSFWQWGFERSTWSYSQTCRRGFGVHLERGYNN